MPEAPSSLCSPFSGEVIRRRFVVVGQVQGVGFRPFVYRLAMDNAVSGFVLNSSAGVIIEVQAPVPAVDAFAHDLEHSPPPLSRIVSLSSEDLDPVPGETGFSIHKSAGGEGHQVLISPDTSTCADCRAEILDPGDRRYLYPFTNCTNCGPRYTITRTIPYDRPSTSMACFPMCEECAREYEDPLNRRFHAQPNACPVCGPQVWFTDREGGEQARGRSAMERAAELLAQGGILALKGLGGFHLASDATNLDAVMELRARKNRWDKPLASMVPDIETARAIAHVSEAEAKWLTSMERPIVLCRAQTPLVLAPGVSPDTAFAGLMLPYTPLHMVLFRLLGDQPGAPQALIMTSGNMSSEPICLGNREALKRLGRIADGFLLHNRDILIRTDDSVLRVNPETGAPQFFRRARGFTPRPVFLPDLPAGQEEPGTVLGVGPELKNTLCLTKGGQAFVGQHIGDMENLENLAFFREIGAHLEHILQVRPQALACDLHPDYMSTRFAQERAAKENLELIPLQHHVAHISAVLAEHGRTEPVLGWALDGTGLGQDGTLWGGELLLVRPVGSSGPTWQRLAHFTPIRLPTGEQAIREPWRTAQGCLHQLGISHPGEKPWPWREKYAQASPFLRTILDKNLNCPQTTSCGRLFDAVSAMMGVCPAITYEGQAAIMLENQLYDLGQWPQPDALRETGYACDLDVSAAPAVLDTLGLFAQVHQDWQDGVPAAEMSRRFHVGLVQGLAKAARHFADSTGITAVALSGGSMQNLTLSVELPKALEAQGLAPLVHVDLPPNDGCISLGQAAWGRLFLAAG